MITRYKHRSDVPYSLHDMRIEKICFEDGTISFQFANGYVSTKSPYSQVDGSLRNEKVDPDFAVVFLLSDNGYMGEFKGCKMSMDDFLRRYDDFSIEIIDELYGYNSVAYGGYLNLPDRNDLIEIQMSFYHEGDIVFETEE